MIERRRKKSGFRHKQAIMAVLIELVYILFAVVFLVVIMAFVIWVSQFKYEGKV